MAYDEYLPERISQILNQKKIQFEGKKMFGGIAFMINGKMCVGVVKNELMARVGKEKEQEALEHKGCRPMDFTGRPMKGYVFVEPEGIDQDVDLDYFIELGLAFNKTLI